MNYLKKIPKPFHSLSLLLVLILSSCKNNNDLNIICPMGAPAITLVDYAKSGNVEITNTASNVKSAFATANYDIIIFDAINGLKLIKTQNAKYRLARILTNGNLFLVATGNDVDDKLTSDDYIVSFGENLIPDLIFKSVYKDKDIKISHYYPSAATAQSGLCSGYHEGNEIDYVILSEPFIHNAISNTSCKNKNIKIIANIAQEFSSKNEEKNYRGFPQAGLFILNKLEDDPSKKDTINSFLKTIDSRMLDLANNSASDTIAFLNKKYSLDQTKQLFGFSGSTLEELQKNKENKLSYNYQNFDIIQFSKDYKNDLKLIDIEEKYLSSYYK